MSDETEIIEATEIQQLTTNFKVCVEGTATVAWDEIEAYLEAASGGDAGRYAATAVALNEAVKSNVVTMEEMGLNPHPLRLNGTGEGVILIEQDVFGEVDYEPGANPAVVAEKIAQRAKQLALDAGPKSATMTDTERTELNVESPLYPLLQILDTEALREYMPKRCTIITVDAIGTGGQDIHIYK